MAEAIEADIPVIVHFDSKHTWERGNADELKIHGSIVLNQGEEYRFYELAKQIAGRERFQCPVCLNQPNETIVDTLRMIWDLEHKT